MVVCWRHAEARAFEPFEDEPLPEGKEPNELRLALVQARGLEIKDKNLLSKGGSSDPFASFEVIGGDTTSKKPFKSQTKYKTLCPRWNELFQARARRPPPRSYPSPSSPPSKRPARRHRRGDS